MSFGEEGGVGRSEFVIGFNGYFLILGHPNYLNVLGSNNKKKKKKLCKKQ